MSQIYVSGLVIVLAQLVNFFGLEIGNEELTIAATTIVSLIAGAWVMYRRSKQGDINVAGLRK